MLRMSETIELESLNADQLRTLVRRKDHEHKQQVRHLQTRLDLLTHEMALYRRWRFGQRSEQLDHAQRSLLDEELEADLASMQVELDALRAPSGAADKPKGQPKRQALPPELPRVQILHEPDSKLCACGCQLKRFGEEVSEKLDYTPGVFTVERHVRGKWACPGCQRITVAPVPAHVIDKGMPTAGLIAHVLVAKYADHQPLYRQEGIFGRAGVPIPRSTQAQWVGKTGIQLQPLVDALRQVILTRPILHADETPVSMLAPGKGKTHQSYLWAYAPSGLDSLKAVVYDFAPGRAGQYPRQWLEGWRGTLVCDDYKGYKALFAGGVTEAGCMAHARRKFNDLYKNHGSAVGQEALLWFGGLYKLERELAQCPSAERHRQRQAHAKPLLDRMHRWLLGKRNQVPDGTATAKAIDYSLRRWPALIQYLKDGNIPIDNNWVENQMRPWALGRSNWLFVGSPRAGHRAAAVMSLIQSARMNGHDPYAYLKDVLTRLPTQRASQIDELLPHRWQSE